MTDPWARPERGFEKYSGPRGADDFQPLDTKASELRAFLRSEEVQRGVRKPDTEPILWVRLPSGATAQLQQKADDKWELIIPLGRDWFEIISGRSREEVLRLAEGAAIFQN